MSSDLKNIFLSPEKWHNNHIKYAKAYLKELIYISPYVPREQLIHRYQMDKTYHANGGC